MKCEDIIVRIVWQFDWLHFAQYITVSPHGIGCKWTWYKKIYRMNRATWLNSLRRRNRILWTAIQYWSVLTIVCVGKWHTYSPLPRWPGCHGQWLQSAAPVLPSPLELYPQTINSIHTLWSLICLWQIHMQQWHLMDWYHP